MKEEDILIPILMVFLTQVVFTVMTLVICFGTTKYIIKSHRQAEQRNAVFYGAIHNLQRTCETTIGWTITDGNVVAVCGRSK